MPRASGILKGLWKSSRFCRHTRQGKGLAEMNGEIAKEGWDEREEELVGFIGLVGFVRLVELLGCVGFGRPG